MTKQSFPARFLGKDDFVRTSSQIWVDPSAPNLGRLWGLHSRFSSLFQMFEIFESRALQRRLRSKIEAKFRTFLPPPLVEIRRGVGKMSQSIFRAVPMTQH